MVGENLRHFGGLPVADFRGEGTPLDFTRTCPRLRCDYDDEQDLRDLLTLLLDQPSLPSLTALVFGLWLENGESYDVSPQPVLDMLVAFKLRLPALKALFMGDIVSEENEISWIKQGDYAGIWAAFPRLEEIIVRGGADLSLGTINHQSLRKLAIQTGGLDQMVVREALSANAPIEHFELWLGDEGYGANTSVADFEALFAGHLFPRLHTLALRNAQYTDAIASALVASPLIDRIKRLDLSKGTLTDAGAQALISSGKLGQLEQIDISFHYVSPEMVSELSRHTPKLIADDPQTPDDWDGETHYYVAVSE